MSDLRFEVGKKRGKEGDLRRRRKRKERRFDLRKRGKEVFEVGKERKEV